MRNSSTQSSRFAILQRSLLLYGAIYLLALVFHPGKPHQFRAFVDIFEILPTLFTTASGFYAAARGRSEGRVRRLGWLVVGLSGLSWTGGQCAWIFYEAYRGSEIPHPSWADACNLGVYPLLFLGLLLLFGGQPLASRIRLLLDGILVAGSIGALGWHYAVEPLWEAHGISHTLKLIEVSSVLGDVACLFGGLVLLSSAGSGRGQRTSTAWAASGIFFWVLADSMSVYDSLTNAASPPTGAWYEWAWYFGGLMIGYGALLSVRPQSSRFQEKPETSVTARQRGLEYLRLWTPYAGVALTFTLIIAHDAGQHHVIRPSTLLSGWLLLVLVVMRQVLTLLENHRLAAQLQTLNGTLERHVEERTLALTQANQSLQEEVAERTRTQAALQDKERRFRSLITHSVDVFAIVDTDNIVCYVSQAIESVWGHTPSLVLNSSCLEWVHPDDQVRARTILEEIRQSPGQTVATELRIRHGDGTWRQAEIVGNNQLADPAVRGTVLTYRDISERKRFEEQLRYQAFHDALTGLPNRVLFLERLERALALGRRRQRFVGILFIDLDNFKFVNDSLGHGAGDQLLTTVAQVIQGCVRPEDTIARFGGDEFALLLEDTDTAQASETARCVADALKKPIRLLEREVFMTASIGVTVSQDNTEAPDSLLRDADVAMYQAKLAGKAGMALFDRSMADHTTERLELEWELHRAIERGELELHYQPIVDLHTGTLREVEALVRWNHPRRGLVSPGHFIPLAEETGLILPLGHWVLSQACRQAHLWQTQCPAEPPLTISVNLSTRQFRQADLVAEIQDVLQTTGLPATCLKLEITESLMAVNPQDTAAKLHQLQELGIRLAVDDFGTGYSSMAYLALFPLDTLKIDKSFVQEIGHQTEATAIVQAIVTLAKTLGLGITCEGIETAEQQTILQDMGSDQGQGYYFSHPLPASHIDAMLRQNLARTVLPPDALAA